VVVVEGVLGEENSGDWDGECGGEGMAMVWEAPSSGSSLGFWGRVAVVVRVARLVAVLEERSLAKAASGTLSSSPSTIAGEIP